MLQEDVYHATDFYEIDHFDDIGVIHLLVAFDLLHDVLVVLCAELGEVDLTG